MFQSHISAADSVRESASCPRQGCRAFGRHAHRDSRCVALAEQNTVSQLLRLRANMHLIGGQSGKTSFFLLRTGASGHARGAAESRLDA